MLNNPAQLVHRKTKTDSLNYEGEFAAQR